MGTNGVAGRGAGAGRGGPRFGVEPFDVGYGAAFQADADGALAVECPLVEDDGELRAHDPSPAGRPAALAFVDGSFRVEARLTRTDGAGTTAGVTGCASAGAVVVRGDGAPLRIEEVDVRRWAIFAGGHRVELPDQAGGWSWEADSVAVADVQAAVDRLQRHMREAEVAIAERLCRAGVLTVLDGPLSKVRSGWDTPLVGYVKTHHRPMLAPDHWAAVPTIGVGQRSSAFLIRDDLFGAYLRVGDPGPWSSPWGGIVRLEVPVGAGLERGLDALDGAAAWLPAYASAAHRDPRAPVNLTPIGGLERHLRRLHGDARLAARAARAAIVALNTADAA
jgi:hypothetical protein